MVEDHSEDESSLDTYDPSPTGIAPPYLTVEAIRNRLQDRRSPAASSTGSGGLASISPRSDCSQNHKTEQSKLKDQASKFVEIATALLEICETLNEGRTASLTEAARIRGSVRDLEELIDSRTEREFEYLRQVRHQQNTRFEKKYQSLVSRARQHILHTQQERDILAQKSAKLQKRTEIVERELNQLREVAEGQKMQLGALREAQKDKISDRDLTELRIRFLRLQDENGKLQLDKQKLQQQVDEMTVQVRKCNPDKSLSFTTMLQIDNTLLGRKSFLSQEAASQRVSILEKEIASLEEERLTQENEFENQKEEIENEVSNYKEYAVFLLDEIERREREEREGNAVGV